MAELVEEKMEPVELSNEKIKSEESLVDKLQSGSNSAEVKDGTRVIILISKKSQDGSHKPVKVVLERLSKKISQHLKLLYIKAHFDNLPINRVLVDWGSTINFMPQIMLQTL